jgi:hypothetical protein
MHLPGWTMIPSLYGVIVPFARVSLLSSRGSALDLSKKK